MTLPDALPCSPAAERNKQPILDVLRSVLPPQARVLEIASGTGQHAAHCAAAEPGWHWQPTEAQAAALQPIAARCAGLANVLPPLRLDVLDALDQLDRSTSDWPASHSTGSFDAVFCANLLHIAPWAACAGLMHGSARALRLGGVLVVYGPFLETDVVTSPGNLAFDADLQARNPAWGLRPLNDVAATAQAAGLRLVQRFAMPANNLVLVFRTAAAEAA